jgi:ubiquinone/menaquinone biosynthesis C-methylase UbiE
MNQNSEINRVRNEYHLREIRLAKDDRYSIFNISALFALQQRERALLQLLKKHGIFSLTDKKILEVGCGSGGVLAQLINYGAASSNLVGIDLLSNRLKEAKHSIGGLGLSNADSRYLPFDQEQFDLVLQFTAFSSILDAQIKMELASEMLRVLKPDGLIIWFDFWLNPINNQTKGIRIPEIIRLFPGCDYDFIKVILAPPIARKLVPISWTLSCALEGVQLLNTHYLGVIRKNQGA